MDTLILSDFESNLSYSGLNHIVWVKRKRACLVIFLSDLNILYNNFHPDPKLATYHQISKINKTYQRSNKHQRTVDQRLST